MALGVGTLAVADGPYVLAGGKEQTGPTLKYLEVVRVLESSDGLGNTRVEGFDSHLRYWIAETSLTPAQGQLPQDGIE